jgi:hypothetical protein
MKTITWKTFKIQSKLRLGIRTQSTVESSYIVTNSVLRKTTWYFYMYLMCKWNGLGPKSCTVSNTL